MKPINLVQTFEFTLVKGTMNKKRKDPFIYCDLDLIESIFIFKLDLKLDFYVQTHINLSILFTIFS